jgi:hypothetical protein
MSAIADPIAAVRALLAADADVAALLAARVFGGELPGAEAKLMPRAAIVVRPAGGTQSIGGEWQDFGDTRIDVRCYGATPREAYALWRTVHPVLKHLKRQVVDETMLHWARPAGGPIAMRDPDTEWPSVNCSWQVLASERPVAA